MSKKISELQEAIIRLEYAKEQADGIGPRNIQRVIEYLKSKKGNEKSNKIKKGGK